MATPICKEVNKFEEAPNSQHFQLTRTVRDICNYLPTEKTFPLSKWTFYHIYVEPSTLPMDLDVIYIYN